MSIVQFSFSYLLFAAVISSLNIKKERHDRQRTFTFLFLCRCWCVRTNIPHPGKYLITHNVEKVFISVFRIDLFCVFFLVEKCVCGVRVGMKGKWTSNCWCRCTRRDSIIEVKLEMITNTKRDDGKRKQWQVGFIPTPPPAALDLYLWFLDK